MKRLSLALAALVIALAAAGPARADYSIIRWPGGDCTIWDNSGWFARPVGDRWSVLVVDLPTYDIARRALEAMYRQGECR